MATLDQRPADDLAGIRDALARLAAVPQQTTEPLSSVEIARNSKGTVQVVVKVYAADPAEAAGTAQGIYDSLAGRYSAPLEVE